MAAFIHETDDGLPDTSLSNIIRLDELSILELLGQVSPFVVLCSHTLSLYLSPINHVECRASTLDRPGHEW
jgi:hypothetical protein